MTHYSYKPASPKKRILANVIEWIVWIAYVISVSSIFDESYGSDGGIVIALLTFFLLQVALMTRSTTLGKLILNMKVVKRDTGKDLKFVDMFFRETLGKFISSLLFGIGYIWIIVDNENRGWHDMIFNTMVVELIPETAHHRDEHDDDFYVQG